jgi:RsiW-degrading membrane proteinase PrsW (M82 family)
LSLFAAIPLGILPMVIYPLFLYWMDRYEKEPLHLIFAAFLWGFIPAAILSLISQLIFGAPLLLLDGTGALFNVVGSVILAPVTEEFFKGLAVFGISILWHDEFDGVFDGIIYGAVVGFGFAAIENVLYFLGGDATLFVLRGVLFGLNHAFFTSLTGIGLGVARNARSRWVRLGAPLLGLMGAMLAHLIHNSATTFAGDAPGLLCVAGLNAWGGVLLVFIVMVLAIRRERTWITEQLREEVEWQTLMENQYEVVSSPLRRFSVRLAVLLSDGPVAYWKLGRYFNTLTELAYKKNAFQRLGEKGAKSELIERLRASAAAQSPLFDNIN